VTDATGILIFGATGGAGLALARLARADRRPVAAGVRPTSRRDALEALGVALHECDVMDPASVAAVFRAAPECGAIVSLLGGKPGDAVFPDAEGNKHVIDAAAAAGSGQFVLVTSVGAGDSAPALPPHVAQVLAPIAALKTQAEEHLRASGLRYTILRPGHLQDGAATERGVLCENPMMLGAIGRDELARVIYRCLDDERCANKTFAVADRQLASPEFAAELIAV
jgi:uncharacterized protein YbjT (DUF2867 family)